MSAVELTQSFLGKIFEGQMPEALAMVDDTAVFVGTRPEASDSNPLFGTFTGPKGAQRFFGIFAELIEPGEFEVQGAFGTDTHACLYGRLNHTVRATGNPFPSDWALVVQAAGGKLTSYHFYEDTQRLAEAMTPGR